MNIGLMVMCVVSLLPVGLMQTWASVEKGYWYARSPEFMHTDRHADSSLAASAGRHDLRPGSRRPGVVRGWAEDGPFDPNGGE